MANQVLMDWEELIELVEDQDFLYALLEAGVVDWDGYERAVELYKENTLDLEDDDGFLDNSTGEA